MLFYITLFLIFFYFKLVRVHKKEERVDNKTYISYFVVAISAIALYGYAINHYSYLSIVVISFLFFIASALLVTAVQVGIFVDGKPLIKMSNLYKSLPYLTGAIAILSITLLLL